MSTVPTTTDGHEIFEHMNASLAVQELKVQPAFVKYCACLRLILDLTSIRL